MKLIEDLGMQYATENSKTKARFGLYECPICGKHFSTQTADVKNGKATKCTDCAHITRCKVRSLKVASCFISDAIKVHGELYDYSLSTYISHGIPVAITCKKHGVFWQTPHAHKKGQGCPACARELTDISTRMYSIHPTTLYYVYLPEYSLWKIGCTKTTIKRRFGKIKAELLESVNFNAGGDAYRLEQLMLASLKTIRYRGINIMVGGNTEIITQPIDFTTVLGDAYIKYLQEYIKTPVSPQ